MSDKIDDIDVRAIDSLGQLEDLLKSSRSALKLLNDKMLEITTQENINKMIVKSKKGDLKGLNKIAKEIEDGK